MTVVSEVVELDHLRKALMTITLDIKAINAAQQQSRISLFLVVKQDMGS